eukprot:TRINITY_DN7265_c0_g1_i1.p1 TRINITY_DN7265_c0_g1~~TRINITY_DN7265_c0_g1_i1.p1  ORF type:complete len:456 (-),score=111.14 TRINITY_DN7265_c0_g1_i1:52-1233(-)
MAVDSMMNGDVRHELDMPYQSPTLQGLTADAFFGLDNLGVGSGKEVNCENCGQPIGRLPSFTCSNNCGRLFHIECVRDPILVSLVCEKCDANPEANVRTFGAQFREAHNLTNYIMRDTAIAAKNKQKSKTDVDGDDLLDSVEEGYGIEACTNTNDQRRTVPRSVLVNDVTVENLFVDNTDELMRRLVIERYEFLRASNAVLYSKLPKVMERIVRDTCSKEASKFLLKLSKAMFSMSKHPKRTSLYPLDAARLIGCPELIIQEARKQVLGGSVDGMDDEVEWEENRTGQFAADVRTPKTASSSSSKEPRRGRQEEHVPSLKDVKRWTVDQVVQYLKTSLDAAQSITSLFEENQVDGVTFLALCQEDLVDDLGISDTQFVKSILLNVSQIHTQKS